MDHLIPHTMGERRRIELERDEIYIVRRPARTVRAWCAGCGEEVDMLTPEEAAVLADRSVREIVRGVEAGQLHFVETDAGRLLLCPRSVLSAPRSQTKPDQPSDSSLRGT